MKRQYVIVLAFATKWMAKKWIYSRWSTNGDQPLKTNHMNYKIPTEQNQPIQSTGIFF